MADVSDRQVYKRNCSGKDEFNVGYMNTNFQQY